jgi:hypothetical protein
VSLCFTYVSSIMSASSILDDRYGAGSPSLKGRERQLGDSSADGQELPLDAAPLFSGKRTVTQTYPAPRQGDIRETK